MVIMYHVVLDKCGKVCHTIGMNKTNTMLSPTSKTMTTTTYKLPTELASLFINNDWSILDYIDDAEYTKCVEQFVQQLEYDGVEIVDIVDDGSTEFMKYHDLADYGVLACECSTYIAHV